MQDPEPTGPQRLGDLLIPRSLLSNSTDEDTPRSSYWTDEDIAKARLAAIRAHLKRGPNFTYSDGFLVTPAGHKIRPSTVMRSKSGVTDFNPLKDATAIRMGAEFVSDNRYWHPGTLSFMDRNGCLIPGPEEECAECGGMPWAVITRRKLSPWAKPWEHNLTYCPRCVSQDEVEAVREAEFIRREQEEARRKRYQPRQRR